MRKTRRLAVLLLPFLLVSFLQAQSLAELAKKEKERRAAVKGKPPAVITTADVAKVKKRPAVETVAQEGEEAAAPAGAAGAEAQAGVTPPATGEAQTQAATPPEGAAAVAPKPGAEAPPGEAPPLSESQFKAKQTELMKAVQAKQEMVDLLTLKLNALYQEFQNLDNMKSREFIQGQIGETYDKLLKAQADAAMSAKELDEFNAKAKREGVPALWIK